MANLSKNIESHCWKNVWIIIKVIGNIYYILIFGSNATYLLLSLKYISKMNVNILQMSDQEQKSFTNDLFWVIK